MCAIMSPRLPPTKIQWRMVWDGRNTPPISPHELGGGFWGNQLILSSLEPSWIHGSPSLPVHGSGHAHEHQTRTIANTASGIPATPRLSSGLAFPITGGARGNERSVILMLKAIHP
jgi:hypothetical protein